MKLVSTTSDTYQLFSQGLDGTRSSNIISQRVTQIDSEDAEDGGVLQRGDAFRSIYVPNPFIQISMKAMDSVTGLEIPELLAFLQVESSVTTFDTYGTSLQLAFADALNPAQNSAVSNDVYKLNSQVFATRGRFNYDLKDFATSQVTLKVTNRFSALILLRVRTEIYSR